MRQRDLLKQQIMQRRVRARLCAHNKRGGVGKAGADPQDPAGGDDGEGADAGAELEGARLEAGAVEAFAAEEGVGGLEGVERGFVLKIG